MKNLFNILAVAILSIGAACSAANADVAARTTPPTGLIRSIQANAEAAHDNAAIYQWRRVNLEVERIIASEHSLEKAFPDDSAPAPAQAPRRAVLDLRGARFAHDSDRTQATAREVSSQCALLLR